MQAQLQGHLSCHMTALVELTKIGQLMMQLARYWLIQNTFIHHAHFDFAITIASKNVYNV